MQIIILSNISAKQILGGALPPQNFPRGGSCPPAPPVATPLGLDDIPVPIGP